MHPIVQDLGARALVGMAGYLAGRGVEYGESNLIRGVRGADEGFSRKGVGTGPLMTGIYAAALGPRGLRKDPFLGSAKVLAPSIMSGVVHGFMGETPEALGHAVGKVDKAIEMLGTPEGQSEIGRNAWKSTEDKVEEVWDANKGPLTQALRETAVKVAGGSAGALAGGVLASLLLSLPSRDSSLKEIRGGATVGEMEDALESKKKKEFRNRLLVVLSGVAGGVLGGHYLSRYLEKAGSFDPRSRLAAALGAYILHPYVENVVAGGSEAMGGSAWSNRRLMPRGSGEMSLLKKTTSSGGSRMLSALGAVLLGPKKLATMTGATIAIAPAIGSGISHRMWPGEGLAKGIDSTLDISRTAGGVTVPGESGKMLKRIGEGYTEGARDFVKEKITPDMVDLMKRYGKVTGGALAGAAVGKILAGVLPEREVEEGRLESTADIMKYLEDRDKRETSREATSSLLLLAGALGGGLLTAHLTKEKENE